MLVSMYSTVNMAKVTRACCAFSDFKVKNTAGFRFGFGPIIRANWFNGRNTFFILEQSILISLEF